MLNAGGNKSTVKSGQRKGKTERQGKKAEPRKQAGGQQGLEAEPRPDQLQDAQEIEINEQINEQISAPVASMDISPLETSATDIIPTVPAVSAEPAAPSPSQSALQRSPMPMAPTPGNRSNRPWPSWRNSRPCGRSTRRLRFRRNSRSRRSRPFLPSCGRFHELYSELARQRVVHLEGFVARITQTTFVLHATRH